MEQSNGFTQLQRFKVHFYRESNRTSSHFVTDVKHVRSVNMPSTLPSFSDCEVADTAVSLL
jgi:hypothetical protein